MKRILLITLATLSGLLLLGSLLAYICKDKVRNIVVTSLNKNLTAKIEVEDISFSLLRHFPYAAVEFKNIKANEPGNFQTTGTVLSAGSLSLLFNYTILFNDEYKLRKIVLRDASINLQVDKDGNLNYEIWKKDSIGDSSFSLELQDVELKNADVLYYNVARNLDVSFLINNGHLSGDFNNSRYELTSVGDLENTSVIIDEVKYLTNKKCQVALSLDVDKNAGVYTFKSSELKLEGLRLAVDGKITDPGEYLEMALGIHSPGADIPALLSLVPDKYKNNLSEYNYSGQVAFTGKITGRLDKKHIPLIAFNFTGKGVNLNPKGTDYHLKQLNCEGNFTNRKNNANPVTYLKLSQFSGLLEGKKINAEIEIENFSRPRLNVKAVMDADLAALSKFYKPDTLNEISGIVKIDAVFKGIAGEKSTYYSAGDLSFQNVAFSLKQKPVRFNNINGLVHLDGNDLQVEHFSGKAGSSDFTLTGNFKNLFAWIFSENQELDVNASLTSSSINLDELMAKDQKSTAHDTIYRLNFSGKLNFHLDVDIAKLAFKKFSATEIRGAVALQNKVLTTKNMDLNTAGGSVMLKGTIDDRPAEHLLISYDAIINGLDISKLFEEMGNFGQQVLQDKNLKGRVTATVQFRSTWNNQLEVDENSIYAKSDISIDNGELNNFEPMLALSRFLKGADLKSVKFSKLSNTIEIRNRKILIPLMEIKSSVMDLTASGEHTFDNIVDYKLRLYLSQLLGKKVKQQNSEFGTIEDDGLGRPMVFMSMKGPVANPKFALDRKAVEQKITTEIKNESKTFKTLLREEFGKADPKKPKANDTKKKEELEIEFDE